MLKGVSQLVIRKFSFYTSYTLLQFTKIDRDFINSLVFKENGDGEI